MCCLWLRVVPLMGAMYLLYIALHLLPYILLGLVVWAVISFIRFHKRRMRAEAEAVQQARYHHQQWRP